jgi:hypothetical protein
MFHIPSISQTHTIIKDQQIRLEYGHIIISGRNMFATIIQENT